MNRRKYSIRITPLWRELNRALQVECFLFILLLFVPSPSDVIAEEFASYSVDTMCGKADVIVEGIDRGGNQVQIATIHKPSPLLNGDREVIEVMQLQDHDKTVWSGWEAKGKILETKRLVLFLVHDSKTGNWASIATIDADGGCGSCGLFWFDNSTCYGYRQMMNPGPYVLTAANGSGARTPQTIASLRSGIAIGLANANEWKRTLATDDPQEKAKALARYLLKSTSPKGDKGTYLYAVRAPMAALGASAVPVLRDVLRSAPSDEKLNAAVLILYDIGPPSAQAIPELLALLVQPSRAFPGYVLGALGSTGDSRAIPALEEFARCDDQRIASDAREALARLLKKRSATSN